MSVITLDMIREYAKFYSINLDDGSQYPGVIGSLVGWEEGKGELNAYLMDSPETNPVFNPLREKYYKANGVEVPPLSQVHIDKSEPGAGLSAEFPGEDAPQPSTGEAQAPVTNE